MKSKPQLARRAASLLSLFAVTGLAGCFSLSRVEPPTRHYVLGGGGLQESGPPVQSLAGLSVGLRRPRVASYLEPLRLAVRQGTHQVTYAEFHLWGEPIGDGVNRAIAGYLAARAPFRGVDVAPWSSGTAHDYLIQLHVERFEGLAPQDPAAVEGEVHMLARWEIVGPRDGVVLARGTTEHRENGWKVDDYPQLVSSLNAGLVAITDDLLAALEKLGTPSTATGIVP